MRPRLSLKSILAFALVFPLLVFLPATAQNAASPQDAAEAWDNSTATRIAFDGDTVDIAGDGAALNNGVLTIGKGGTYVLSGKWHNGQICIRTGKEEDVRLVMNGVSVHSADSAPLYAARAGKVIITLVRGTENALSDGGSYSGEDVDAALYVQDDLTINGRGALSVTANYKHGIVSKDDLLVESGTLRVTAADVGIRGRDSLKITGGEITVTAKGDALQSNNDEDTEKGHILLSGGSYRLTSAKDGIQAESSLTISGGDYMLHTGGDKKPADGVGKGLKAGTELTISGGTFALQCGDNALHAKGNVLVTGGRFEILTEGDALHSGGAAAISGGELLIEKCYEGVDAAAIVITGGEIHITSADDGLNASSDESAASLIELLGEAPTADTVRIAGGNVWIRAAGDGIDAAGSLLLEGGTLTVSGGVGSSKKAVDFADSFTVSGGVLVALGSVDMNKVPGADSRQPTLMARFSAPVAAKSTIAIAKEDGTAVLDFTPGDACQALLLSTPQLMPDTAYSLLLNGEALATFVLQGAVTTVSIDPVK